MGKWVLVRDSRADNRLRYVSQLSEVEADLIHHAVYSEPIHCSAVSLCIRKRAVWILRWDVPPATGIPPAIWGFSVGSTFGERYGLVASILYM